LIKASVLSSKAVVLGENVACDGHDNRRFRVVTHAHYDHVYGLKESLLRCEAVYATPITRGMLTVLYSRRAEGIKTINYGEPVMVGDEIMMFYPANHIPGSAQVLVEDSDGFRALYTGDFRLPGAPIIEADVLVIEATYGHPRCVRPPIEDVYHALISLVESEIKKTSIHVYGFYGKVQEVMEVLRRSGVDAPFLAQGRMYEVTEVCRRHGMKLGEVVNADSREGLEILKSGGCVYFKHSSKLGERVNGVKIHLTGWQFKCTYRRISEDTYRVSLSSHSDFNHLLAYVEDCKPKLVVVDNSRDGYGEHFASEIRRRLGIKAIASP